MALSARANAHSARGCCHGPVNLATTGVPIERRSGVPFECRLTTSPWRPERGDDPLHQSGRSAGLILLAELCGLGPHPGLPLARQCRLGLVGSPSLGIQLLAQRGNRRLQRPDCAADIAMAVTGLVTLTLRLLGRDCHPDSAVIAGLT